MFEAPLEVGQARLFTIPLLPEQADVRLPDLSTQFDSRGKLLVQQGHVGHHGEEPRGVHAQGHLDFAPCRQVATDLVGRDFERADEHIPVCQFAVALHDGDLDHAARLPPAQLYGGPVGFGVFRRQPVSLGEVDADFVIRHSHPHVVDDWLLLDHHPHGVGKLFGHGRTRRAGDVLEFDAKSVLHLLLGPDRKLEGSVFLERHLSAPPF